MKERALLFPVLTALTLVFSLLLAHATPVLADLVTVEPDRKYVNTCLPFGIGDPAAASGYIWYPHTVYVYQNVPAFTLQPGSILAFDMTKENDVDIGLAISMAPASANGGTHNASPFVPVVSNTQNPGRGDSVMGNYDLEFSAETTFDFPGGGLLIRFSDPSVTFQGDDTCTNGILSANGWDASGYFKTRFVHDADGLPPWDQESNLNILAFQVDSSPLSYDIEKTARDVTGAEITRSSVGDTVTYRIVFSNNDAAGITSLEITDSLPEDTAFIGAGAVPAAAVTYDAGPPAAVIWSVGDVASGGSASLEIDVAVQGSADGKILVNTAEVTAIGSPHTAMPTDTAEIYVGDGADLDVDVTYSDWIGVIPFAGDGIIITFSIDVTNNGPDTAANVLIENVVTTDPHLDPRAIMPSTLERYEIYFLDVDPLPAGISSCFIDTTRGSLLCDAGDLTSGQSVSIQQEVLFYTKGSDVDLTYLTKAGSGGVDPPYNTIDPVTANNSRTGTLTVVRTGSGGSGGCNTSVPLGGQPLWSEMSGVALVAILFLLRVRRRGKKRREG